jgi:transglutaminase-like putative cysteine protease
MHNTLSGPPSTLTSIPPGKEGTKYTLNLMRQLVRQGKKSPAVRQLAVELTQGLMQKDWLGEVTAIHKFVRDNIRYTRDIRGVETLHTVERILTNAAGDCDDKSVLAASLLEALGHPTRFVAIGFKAGSFSHVYPETLVGNKWIALETTEPVAVGWKPKNIANALILNN